jgi:hypothetical protein
MKFSVLILPKAMRDIDRNVNWWAEQHSVDEALRWSDAIYDTVYVLAVRRGAEDVLRPSDVELLPSD